jgi:hypothetical protein
MAENELLLPLSTSHRYFIMVEMVKELKKEFSFFDLC